MWKKVYKLSPPTKGGIINWPYCGISSTHLRWGDRRDGFWIRNALKANCWNKTQIGEKPLDQWELNKLDLICHFHERSFCSLWVKYICLRQKPVCFRSPHPAACLYGHFESIALEIGDGKLEKTKHLICKKSLCVSIRRFLTNVGEKKHKLGDGNTFSE